MKQLHQEAHFGGRTLPILAREQKQGEVLDTEFARSLDDRPGRILPPPMPLAACQPALAGPAPVAIHYDCDMPRQPRRVELKFRVVTKQRRQYHCADESRGA